MSIATRTGDEGTTALMFGRRVPKSHPRVEAYGTVDELNAALGLARAQLKQAWMREQLFLIQKDLVAFMGELAVDDADQPRYRESYPCLTPAMLERVDEAVRTVEGRQVRFEGWATPGGTPAAAALDLARTVARRAERAVVRLKETGQTIPALSIPFLNRLSDMLWLFARLEETGNGAT